MVTERNKKTLFRILIIICLLPLLAYTIWCSYNIYLLSQKRAELKKDYSAVNNIQYGLLSVDRWRDNITEIVNDKIDEFSLTKKQEKDLKKEINSTLNALITQADGMMNEKQTKLKGKLKKLAYNTFVDLDKIRKRVPEFSQTILNHIKNPAGKDKLKHLAQDKINDFADETRDSIAASGYDSLLAKYKMANVANFNKLVMQRSDELQNKSYVYTYTMLILLVVILIVWWVFRRKTYLHSPLFIISILIAFVFLFAGITTPMIEIDARLQQINFVLIGKSIEFNDQVLFYESKSILDVVRILISTEKTDSIFVGGLILVFSIVFPIAKLIATQMYMSGSQRVRNWGIVKFFAFKSGKWSMADVMIVAIFMAYIGFKGILESKVGQMTEDMNNQFTSSIATNNTSLQPGFLLFIAFVFFGLILSTILKSIIPKNETVIVIENTTTPNSPIKEIGK